MSKSLLTLIDDIASVMDDVAVLTKVAAKKTSGVIGDDLALNAKQLSGLSPDKELEVVWKVCKGSFKNKVILVPLALLISYFMPILINPLLMIGGLFLCFEGVEKLLEKIFPHSHKNTEVVSQEEKIKAAIRTDFILSAEIIVISLGAIATGSLLSQIISLCIIALAMNFGVYGLVAFIVKLDDIGLHLFQKTNRLVKTLGKGLIISTPVFMKTLGVVGTAAMFLVGGGIIVHGIPAFGHALENWTKSSLPEAAQGLGLLSFEGLTGIVAGLLVVGGLSLIKKVKKNEKS